MLRFLDLDHLAKLSRLGRFALANGLGVLFKQAQHFVLEMRVALEHPGFRLLQNPLGQLAKVLQLLHPGFEPDIPQPCGCLLDAAGHLLHEDLRLR